MFFVTPRCAAAAAAVVSAVVLRRPTKEYTHQYSMMHPTLPTAGINVALFYHQLLVQVLLLSTPKYGPYFVRSISLLGIEKNVLVVLL